jgi:hypothetical protein
MGCSELVIRHQWVADHQPDQGAIMAKRKKQSKALKRKTATARGKARKVAKAARGKATKRTAKPKPAPVKKAARKVKKPVTPVIETVAAQVIEQPAPVTVPEVEETPKAS